jgi:dTDP-4-dehydrorhamnose reductase
MDATRHEIPVVMDQVTTPTPAAGLAAALRQLVMDRIAGRDLPALLHFAGQPATDWFTFSKAIVLALAEAGVARLPAIVPVLSTEHPRTALRPAYSALDCSCATALGYEVPGWLPSLPPLIAAFCEKRIAA